MTRNSIAQRLYDQGHVVLHMIDTILNKRTGYIQNLENLLRDGQISTQEAILLIGDDSTEFNNPHIQHIVPPAPLGYPDTKWPNPVYCQTTTFDKVDNG